VTRSIEADQSNLTVLVPIKVMREFENRFECIIACCFDEADKTLYESILARS